MGLNRIHLCDAGIHPQTEESRENSIMTRKDAVLLTKLLVSHAYVEGLPRGEKGTHAENLNNGQR